MLVFSAGQSGVLYLDIRPSVQREQEVLREKAGKKSQREAENFYPPGSLLHHE